jgi:hypothetical protein
MLIDVSNEHLHESETADLVFGDPVGYLALFGIDAQVVAEPTLPAAA